MINCFGILSSAARVNTMIPIPHTEKTAVVTIVALVRARTKTKMIRTVARNST